MNFSLSRHSLWLAPALGALATLGFPPFDLKPLPLLALALLFALAAGAPWRRAALLGWLFGLTHFASGIYWVFISTHIYGGAPWWLGLLLALLLFAYMALYPALVLAAAVRLRLFESLWGYAGLPALWLLAEFLRGWVFTGFPWLSLGYAGLDTPLQQFAPVFGVQGMSAVIVLMALALQRALSLRGRARSLPVAVLAAPLLLALLLPAPGAWTRDDGAPITVALLQPNVAQDQKWLPQNQRPMLLQIRDMTLAALDAELVVWPEVAVSQRYDELRGNLLMLLDQAAAARGSTVLAGMIVSQSPRGDQFTNSVIALGSSHGRYDKHHLVPFGEYFPIPDWLRPMMDVLGTPYSDFLFGALGQPALVVGSRPLGVNICFEDVFPAEIAQRARTSSVLVNMTNDAWFGRSGAAEQHLQIARMRALETGRPHLRASNTGPSAVIGPDGQVQIRAGFFRAETLRARVQPRTGDTPYMRWADAPLWGFSIGLLLILVVRLRYSR